MSTTEKLNELNTLRAARNQPALKSWKGSTKALDDTLAAYKTHKVAPAVAEGAYANGREAEARTGIKGTAEKNKAAIAKANAPKAVKGDTVARQAARKVKAASDLVSLADIARELKIEPKLARAKARRSTEITKLAQGDAWAFKPADVAQVKKLLK